MSDTDLKIKLVSAIQEQSVDEVRALLAAGASPTVQDKIYQGTNPQPMFAPPF